VKVKKIIIGQYLAKILTKVSWHVFLWFTVYRQSWPW